MENFEPAINVSFNGDEFKNIHPHFSYKELESVILEVLSEKPVFVVIHGVPGTGKSFLASLLSERLLHCFTIDFDAFCRRGNKIDLLYSPKEIEQSMNLILRIYFQYKCNVIYTTSVPQDNLFQNLIPKFYDVIVLDFDNIGAEKSLENNINELTEDQVRFMCKNYKQYKFKR